MEMTAELEAKVYELVRKYGDHGNWYNTDFFKLLYMVPEDLRLAFQWKYRADHDISNVIDFIQWIKQGGGIDGR